MAFTSLSPASISRHFTLYRQLVNTYVKAEYFCTATMSSTDWKSEKDFYLNAPLEKKRKFYKTNEFITLDGVEKWSEYAVKYNVASKAKPTAEDLKEFARITINPSLNQQLADKVSLFRGDITKLEIDAIVNAANSQLRRGGGVDGAIHRAAGEQLQEECSSLGGCPTGDAKITGGYCLPAKYVIQTVGPEDQSATSLASCYRNCLSHVPSELRSIAFPCVATGLYRFPNRLAAHIALSEARTFLERDVSNTNQVERLIFCTFLQVDEEIYETLMQLYFPLD